MSEITKIINNPKSDYKIINSTWRSNIIGIIAVEYPKDGYWQAYIGIGRGLKESDDLIYIAEYGDKLSWHEAHAFFPYMDIELYKTWPQNLLK